MLLLSTFSQRLKFALAWEWGKLRFFWFTRVLRTSLRTHHNIDLGTAGVEYSRKFFGKYSPDTRIFYTMFLLCSVPDLKKDALLILGPRYETELLLARAIGFSKNHIKALDTHSYSPLIDVGDMHQMPYPDGQFTAILCAWTLSYSTNPLIAAQEMTRVLAPSGYLVIAVQKIEVEYRETIEGVLSPTQRMQTKEQIDSLFPKLERVAGFEPLVLGNDSHTVVMYRKN